MATTPADDSSFSAIKAAYVSSENEDADGHDDLTDGSTTTPISMSLFRDATFTAGAAVAGSGAISILDQFKVTAIVKGNPVITGRTFAGA